MLDGKSGNIFLRWDKVKTLISLPNPSSTKKDGERLLFFILKEGVGFGKRQLKIICWNLSQAKTSNELQVSYGPLHFKGEFYNVIHGFILLSTGIACTGTEAHVLSSLTSTLISIPVVLPDNAIFRTSKGVNYLKCYKGITV